jgi:CRP-like cAMP-binding protein
MMTLASDALSPDRPSANRLLAALPRAEYLRLLPHLQRVSLAQRQSLYAAQTSIPYVWFIERGVVSVVRGTQQGALAFGQLLGVDERIGDLLAVVKHFGFIEGGGITVCGPENNRHTAECTRASCGRGRRVSPVVR